MNLSPHFTIKEAEASNTAKQLGLVNKLDVREHVVAAVHTALFLLEPIRERFGPFSPNSWYRSYLLNQNIKGSSKTSDHLLGRAVDVEIPGVDNLDLAWWISENLEFDQLISEKYVEGVPTSGWVHLSYRLDANRMQRKTYAPGSDPAWRTGLPARS